MDMGGAALRGEGLKIPLKCLAQPKVLWAHCTLGKPQKKVLLLMAGSLRGGDG